MTDDPPCGALAVLADQAESLAGVLMSEPDLAEQARVLAERTRQTRFHVASIGVFKRGKSTLINALLGEEIQPTGVLSLTAIATEISFEEVGRFDADRLLLHTRCSGLADMAAQDLSASLWAAGQLRMHEIVGTAAALPRDELEQALDAVLPELPAARDGS